MRELKPLKTQQIELKGFNMCLIIHPQNPNKYLATIRCTEKNESNEYPTLYNSNYLLFFDEELELTGGYEITEQLETPRVKYKSYTEGLEDIRLIDDKYLIAGTTDSNNEWMPELMLCEYNIKNGSITKMISLADGTPQKNWLVLKSTLNMYYVLHSYDPLKIITIDKESGSQNVIHYQKVFNLEDCHIHGGACVYLEDKKQYLVSVRVKKNNQYHYSLWILLNEKYKLVASSEPFLFFKNKREICGVKDKAYYEMCMSIIEKGNDLICSVSVNDQDVFILKYRTISVLNLIKN